MNLPASAPSLCPGKPLLWPAVPAGVHWFSGGGVLVLILLFLGFSKAYDGRDIWSGWVESREFRRPAYAERIHAANLFRTRANTWSNLAFVLVGFYALGLGVQDWRSAKKDEMGHLSQSNSMESMQDAGSSFKTGFALADSFPLKETPALSLLFGLACCHLGFASGLFHASFTRWGQQLDVSAMYCPLLGLIAISISGWVPRLGIRRSRNGVRLWPFLIGAVLVGSYFLYQYKWSMNSAKVLGVLILTVASLAGLDWLRRRGPRTLLLFFSFLSLLLGHACREWDIARRFSGPDDWFQGHALWHLFSALSLGCLYLFYRLPCLPFTRFPIGESVNLSSSRGRSRE